MGASHTTSPTAKPAICPYEFSGLIATSDCSGYYHCVNGDLAVESPTDCPAGLLFDNDLQVCDWDYNVDCPSNPITSAPTVSSSAEPTLSSSAAPTVSSSAAPTLPLASSTTNPTEESAICPSGYSGLIATSDCKGYYHCSNGDLIDENPTYCQDGLLFDDTLKVCDWEDNIDCSSNLVKV